MITSAVQCDGDHGDPTSSSGFQVLRSCVWWAGET